MNKRKQILEAAKFIISLNKKVDLDTVYLLLASKSIVVSKTYIGQVLCWHEKKKIKEKQIVDFSKVIWKDEIKKNTREDFAQRRMEMAKLTREGWNLQMIAEKYNITRQAVSLLLKKAASEGHVVVKSKKKNMKDEKNVVLVRRLRKEKRFCEQCGKEFFSNTKKNCSKECFEKSIENRSGGKWSRKEFVTLTCLTCGKNFERSNYIHQITMKKKNNENNNYCSRDCYHISTRKNPVQGV